MFVIFLPCYIHFSLTRGEKKKKVFLGLPRDTKYSFDRYKELMRLLGERAEGKEYLGNSVAAGKRVRTLKPYQMKHFVVVMVNGVL